MASFFSCGRSRKPTSQKDQQQAMNNLPSTTNSVEQSKMEFIKHWIDPEEVLESNNKEDQDISKLMTKTEISPKTNMIGSGVSRVHENQAQELRKLFVPPYELAPQTKHVSDTVEEGWYYDRYGNAKTIAPNLIYNCAPPVKTFKGDRKDGTVFLLLRHGEAEHNIDRNHRGIDPALTRNGRTQASIQSVIALSNKQLRSITHIFCSPMRRTIQTALLYFEMFLEFNSNFKIILLPSLRERGSSASSIGTDLNQLKKLFKNQPLDWTHVEEGWETKNDRSKEATYARAIKARKELMEMVEGGDRDVGKEKHGNDTGKGNYVAVVSHGGFLQALIEDEGTVWSNCGIQEYRAKPGKFDPTLPFERLPEVEEEARRKMDEYLEKIGDPENLAGRSAKYVVG